MNYFSVQKNHESVQTIVTRRHDSSIAHVAWTDGSCDPNPGPGGWGYRVEFGGTYYEDRGGEPDTSNNRMEMVAIIRALEACNLATDVIVRTDSQLVLLCAVGRWKRKSNLDLWQDMAKLCAGRRVAFEWWRSHCGTEGNERADYLAKRGREEAWEQSIDRAAAEHLRAIVQC